ncbi:MAG: flagellar filament capping protein FliD [Nitrospirae bacterium]|nr:flagellar filament capping protein FliD [Nitrospirota bacterium]
MATNSAAISAGTGLVSGINYAQLISELTAVDQQPITQMQQRQQDYQLQIAALSTLSTNLSSFKSALDTLNSADQFNTKKATVTNTSGGISVLNVSASSSAAAGTHSITVNQLAESNIKASQGWADKNTTAIDPSGGTFSFKVGSGGALTKISVSSTMTLQGLANAINSSGSSVTASVMNDGSGINPYRLELTTNSTGYSNEIYITQNTATGTPGLDFTDKQVGTAYAYTSNSYAGTVASSGTYTGTTNKTYLLQIVNGDTPGSGNATYKYSTDGGVTWYGAGGVVYNGSNGVAVAADNTPQNIDGTHSEGVKVSFNGGTLAAGDQFSIAAYNPEMQTAQNAVLNVDGATITNSSNTITDAVQGVTMNLLQADSSSPVTLSVSSDTSTAQTNIQSFVTAYNTLMQYINQQRTYDPSQNTAGTDINQTNPLLTDPALLLIKSRIVNTVTGTIPGITPSQYSGLSQIGISTDSTTGILSLDTSKLSSALQTNPSAVSNLFISSATPTNAAVSYVSKTSNTQPGNYSVYVTTAPQKASVSGGGSSNGEIGQAYAYPSNSYAGTASSSGAYTGTRNKTYLLQIVNGDTPGSGNATYKYSTDGGVTWYGSGGVRYNGSNGVAVAADNTPQNIDGTHSEGVKVSFNGGTLAAGDQFSVAASCETLTFEYTNNNTSSPPAYTDFGVTLPAGSTINQIVDTLNSAFATKNVGLTASNVNGNLSITSADYGAKSWFQVSSSDQTGGVLGAPGANSAPVTGTGVDIAGMINGHPAIGSGDVLTSFSDFPESGLSINVDSSKTGGYGTIAVSSGIASSLSSAIASYTNSTTGIIVTESNSNQTNINNLTTQENTIASRINQETQLLQTQFAQLETLLATYKTQSAAVTSMFANLGSGWAQNSGGTL